VLGWAAWTRAQDFGMECRIGRFHNIYGPFGTWKGGREKAPAAFSRKAITSTKEFEMWGNGLQTRSFCYIDDCVEGILRLMVSDYKKPLNIGSDEMVSMNFMASLVLGFKGDDLPIKHIPGPEGVRGRNSDNTLIKQVLGWAPATPLKEGLKYTYDWINAQVEEYKKAGNTVESLTQSKVVSQQMADEVRARATRVSLPSRPSRPARPAPASSALTPTCRPVCARQCDMGKKAEKEGKVAAVS
jgi:GDP-D-mannose 3',5'-epimerase